MPATPLFPVSSAFAAIGRAYPSEAYQGLYDTSLVARAERRAEAIPRWNGGPRKVWRGSGEPITLPIPLMAY